MSLDMSQDQPEDNLMVAIFGHGKMAHIPWALSQSIPEIALYSDPVFNKFIYILLPK